MLLLLSLASLAPVIALHSCGEITKDSRERIKSLMCRRKSGFFLGLNRPKVRGEI